MMETDYPYYGDDGISSVRTDLTTIQTSNVRKVVVHCSVAFNACHFDSLVNEIPEEDRQEFVANLLGLVESNAKKRRILRPRIIERMFLTFVGKYNGNLDIEHLGQQIENLYNFQATHNATVSLIRARYHELAVAAAGRGPHAPPLPPDGVPPSSASALSSSKKPATKLASTKVTNPTADQNSRDGKPPTGPGGGTHPGTGGGGGSAST